MSTLPLLKSGQLAQYPVERSLRLAVDTVEFLDGSEQRCARTRVLREWTIYFGLIDEQEFTALKAFVAEQQGTVGTFQFTDPVDGVQYNNCSLSVDVTHASFDAPGRVKTILKIRENPN